MPPPPGAGCPSAAGAASGIGHARFWSTAPKQSQLAPRSCSSPSEEGRRLEKGTRSTPRWHRTPRRRARAATVPSITRGCSGGPGARRGTWWEDGHSGGAAQCLFHPSSSCSVEPAGLQPPPAPSRFAPSLLLLSWGLAAGASPSPLTFGIPRFANAFSPRGAFGCPYKNAFPHPQGELTFPPCAARPAAGAAAAGFGGRAGWGRPRPTGDPKAVG